MTMIEIEKGAITESIQQKIDQKTKPLGALGFLEKLAAQIAQVQHTLTPELIKPHIIVFAGSHGIASEGVSAYPSEVTSQMVLNFLSGGAAINVFARQHHIELKIVDAGVDFIFSPHDKLIDAKIGHGTKSFLTKSAMTQTECEKAISKGKELVEETRATGCNVIGFGEMGIGNSSSASVIMSKLLDLPMAECVGRGTGLDDAHLERKIALLLNALNFHQSLSKNPMEVLQTFGGFEMAMMCGAMIEAGQSNMLVLVDGFIASTAFLCASLLHPNIRQNAIFCHQSDERGHKLLLQQMNAEPILQLGMRLGEGTGCAVAYPLLQSAVSFFNEMASFESAGVSSKSI